MKIKLNKKSGAAVVALTLVTLLAACGSKASSKSATSDKATEYDYVYATDPDTLDYTFTGRATNSSLTDNFVDGLMETNRTGQIKGALAKAYKVSNDGKTYTYTLRKGVQWVDSQGNDYAEVTAQDFVTGLKHAVAVKSEPMYVVQDSIKGLSDYVNGKTKDFSTVGVKAIGKYKIQYTLNQAEPYWNSKTMYGILKPVNAKFLKQEGKKFGTVAADAILYNGPYILSNFTSKSVIEYKANDKYWDKKNVHIKTVKLTFNDGSNPDALYKSFIKGEYTAARVYPNLPGYKAVEKTSGKNIVWSRLAPATYNFTFNLDRASYNATSKTTSKAKSDTKKALLNKNFRLAIIAAFDRENYAAQTNGAAGAKKALRNTWTPWDFVQADGKDYGAIVQANLRKIDPTNYGNVNLADLQDGLHNKSQAATLMAKAKKELKAEGVSFPIHLDLPVSEKTAATISQDKSFKQSVESSLGTDNVNVDIQMLSQDKYLAATYSATTGAASDFDVSNASGWSPDYADPSTYLDIYKPSTGASLITFGLTATSSQTGGNKYTAVEKQVGLTKYEELVDKAEKITTNTDARYKAFAKAEAYLMSIGVQFTGYAGGGTPSVTKIVPFTQGVTWSGDVSASFKYTEVQKKAVTTKEYNAAYAKWLKARAAEAK